MIEKNFCKFLLFVGFCAAAPLRSIPTITQDHEPAIQTYNLHGYGSNQGLVKATEEKLGVSIADFVLEYINANRKAPWIRECLQNPALCKGRNRSQKPSHGGVNKAQSNSSPRSSQKQYDSSFPDYDSGSEVEYHYVANRPDH